MPTMRRPDPAKIRTAGRLISMIMGFILSFFQSLAGQLRSGHFTFQGWIISLALSIAISWLIGYFVPMGKISQKVCKKLKCPEGSLKARIAESAVSDLIFSPFITLANVFLAWRSIPPQSRPPFLPMVLSSLGISLLIGLILVFIFQPICKKLVLSRVFGNQGMER